MPRARAGTELEHTGRGTMGDSNQVGTAESQRRGRKTAGAVVRWANVAKALAGAVLAVGGVWAGAARACAPTPAAPEPTPPPTTTAICAEVQAERPVGNILLSRWGATEFRLKGSNNCGRDVTVHVAFFALSERFRFRPPAGCKSEYYVMDDPACWAEQVLEEGEVDWPFYPPALHPLDDPPRSTDFPGAAGGEVIEIGMKWVVYADQTDIVDAQTRRMRIRDDRPAG